MKNKIIIFFLIGLLCNNCIRDNEVNIETSNEKEEVSSDEKEFRFHIIYPEYGKYIKKDKSLLISTNTNIKNENIYKISFYLNDTIIGETNEFPWQYEWDATEIKSGEYTLKAKLVKKDNSIKTHFIIFGIDDVIVPPISEFKSNQTKITPGHQIQFTDLSTNKPLFWNWDFGDGNKSTLQNPTHNYKSIGKYTVTLETKNIHGANSKTKKEYITVSLPEKITDEFTDSRDGKTYKTIKIGNQIWMAENLSYETSSGSWVYDDDPENEKKYGRIYQWRAATKAPPEGWHLPSLDEYIELFNFLGGDLDPRSFYRSGILIDNINTSLLKSTSGWKNNENGNNESGFNIVPAGRRTWKQNSSPEYIYENHGEQSFFWTSYIFDQAKSSFAGTVYFSTGGKLFISNQNSSSPYGAFHLNNGCSIRCIKD